MPPDQPNELVVTNVYATSVQVSWFVARTAYGSEAYYVQYGLTPSNFDMQSEIIRSASYQENLTYSINLDNLLPFTTYYYRVTASNIVGTSFSDVANFTTSKSL